ncbi:MULTISPECIES: carboxypeptidase regulatory-like domain-containing protein [unclassified Treponema]|uniref:carboxypeptidase regulatory-like domain-containing protein n=1 Tax=unclassified Treponema TaxID=2638727 RepID=UPI0020A31F92|nr:MULTISPECIES: carboxypeptidase regulatory-like domain-containing protein [unclassified Treponema]UTC67674.1 carboxypeptidase regulatory-like domain-containing protein [Treponema sp. OMZ 789]UTC70402.1 carboxypeptidase regulatory-like domain-containing protein [Treponema sp. OMZ 790]UTC73116.1 carboxypeptidase regulatory-like domain-containing protein [Treponema sp. OMZ 791]
MSVVHGVVRDKNKKPVPYAKAALLTERFEVIVSCEADENGCFSMEVESKKYPYFIASKGFHEQFLEFWGHNIDLRNDLEINPKLGKIEIFSLIFFPSLDTDNSMMIYFRPMSLRLLLGGEKAIAPELNTDDITVSINRDFYQIVNMRVISETHDKDVEPIKAYALKIMMDGIEFDGKNKLEISIIKDDDYGEAVLFF